MSASSAGERPDRLPLEAFGEECRQCGAALEYVGIGKSDRRYQERTVHEYLKCPSCGAGGALVKLAENDKIRRRLGPATRSLLGRSADARERSFEPASAGAPQEASATAGSIPEGWSE